MNFASFQKTIFFLLLAGVTVVFVWMLQGFLQPVFWAVVLAIVFHPVQQLWLRVVRNRHAIAAVLTLATIFCVVLLPLFGIGSAVVSESRAAYSSFRSGYGESKSVSLPLVTSPIFDAMERFGIRVDRYELSEKFGGALQSFSQLLVSRAVSIGQDAVRFGVHLFVMLYVLYFFLYDGDRILEKFLSIVPLGNSKERRLVQKFAKTTRATMKGTVIIGIIQGAIGGVLFWIAGIGAPVVWGSVMTILSIIPAVGSFLVWAPAGIILLVGGNIWQGVLVLLGGAFVIGLIDNLLRPVLVGHDTEMPDVLILLSTLGGLSVFGVSGFVIGPIIAAFFLAVWDMFAEEYKDELQKMG